MALLFLSFLTSQAQQSKDLEGRVHGKNGDVSGTHILNVSSNKGTITDGNGFFSITVKLNDTLVFSAIQLKRKELVVNSLILESKLINVYLEDGEIRLDEVLVTPYNLTGDIKKDTENMDVGTIITSSTLNLPNAHVKPPTQSQRKLYAARTWDFKLVAVKLDPLINYFSGRTKMLNRRVAREARYKRLQSLRKLYVDSLFIKGLDIPKLKIMDFMHFCEVDSVFQTVVDSHDQFGIWEFLQKKSMVYRRNNNLD